MLPPAQAQSGDQGYVGFVNQCFNKPKTYSDAIQDPIYLYVCIPQGRGCFQPAAPELDSDGTVENLQAQTAIIKANKPNGFAPDVVIWEAWYEDAAGGLTLIWRSRSKSSIVSGENAPYLVRYGAPGLVESAANRFRVAYCTELSPGVLDRCTCFSAFSYAQTTDDFHGEAPPSPLCQEIEDSFERNNTTAMPTGDGLGPSDPMDPTLPPGVWSELALFGSEAGRGKIVNKSRARLEEGAYVYRRRGSSDPRAYVEAFYFRDPSQTTNLYDVDVLARLSLGGSGQSPIGYDIKLDNEVVSGGTLRLYRPSGAGLGGELASWPLTTALGTKCNGTVPLANDVNTGVWLQIEVSDDAAGPKIDARVGWGGAACGPDGQLSSSNCTYYCAIPTYLDPTAPIALREAQGIFAMSTHHRTVEVKKFRGGSRYLGECP